VQPTPESQWAQKIRERTLTTRSADGQGSQPEPVSGKPANDSESSLLHGNVLPAVGALSWPANVCRPDIAHAVNRIAGEVNNPTPETYAALRRLFQYMRTTAELGITYRRSRRENGPAGLRLVMYSDADWAGCLETRKSTTGTLAMLAGAAVHWRSVRQQTVAMSSTEAEYIAAAETALMAVYLRKLLAGLGQPQPEPSPLFIDNTTTISVASDDSYAGRRKHIDVKHHKIRELNGKEIQARWVPTRDELADILTKALGQSTFDYLRDAVLGRVDGNPGHE
jgi:hypothetical protein